MKNKESSVSITEKKGGKVVEVTTTFEVSDRDKLTLFQLKQTIAKLKEVTRECRFDMHEPDEQGIEARVVGDHLDNAFGTDINPDAIAGGFQEYVVILNRENPAGGKEAVRINLADLIAIARLVSI